MNPAGRRRRRRSRIGKAVLLTVALGTPLPLLSASSPEESPAPSRPLAPYSAKAPAEPPGPADGNSLGEIVRRSKEERTASEAKKQRSLGTITNETLKKDGTKSPGDASAGKKGSGTLNVLPKGSMPAPPAGSAGQQVLRDGKGRSEEEWRGIAAANRAQIEKADGEVKRLDLETKRLENDFYAWSDGNYRERVIRPNWDQARESLTKARADLDSARARRADLEEEARKAGTPPGWLREP